MHRYAKYSLLFVVLGAIIGVTVAPFTIETITAQDNPPPDNWYLAYDPDSGRFIGFTMDGDTPQILLDAAGVISPIPRATRLDSQRTFIEMGGFRNEPIQYLMVSPGGIDILHFEAFLSSEDGSYEIVAHHPPFIVVRASQSAVQRPVPALLLNYETHETWMLSGLFHTFVAVRFSKDGQFLRYASVISEDLPQWFFFERELATGEEHLVYTHTASPTETIHADQYGDHFLIYQLNEDTNIRTAYLLSMDSNLEPIAESSRENPVLVRIIYDNLVIQNLFCETDCVLRVRRIGEARARVYTMPTSGDVGFILPLNRDDVLIPDTQGTWIMDEDQPPQLMEGYFSTTSGIVRLNVADILSPDHRWIWLSNDPDQPTALQLWDLENRAIVYTHSMTRLPDIMYGERGVFLDASNDPPIYYRFADGAEIVLPVIEQGAYQALLPDETFLYQTVGDEHHIYHYNPFTDIHTLLFENMQLIVPVEFFPRL